LTVITTKVMSQLFDTTERE